MNPNQSRWVGGASPYNSHQAPSPSLPVVSSHHNADSAFPELPSLPEDGTGPWYCPRCSAYNPELSTICSCGYHNIGAIQALRAEEPVQHQATWVCGTCGITQNGDNTGTCGSCKFISENQMASTVWKCPNPTCKYEYNLLDLRQCQKCSTPNPTPPAQPAPRAPAQQVAYSLPAHAQAQMNQYAQASQPQAYQFQQVLPANQAQASMQGYQPQPSMPAHQPQPQMSAYPPQHSLPTHQPQPSMPAYQRQLSGPVQAYQPQSSMPAYQPQLAGPVQQAPAPAQQVWKCTCGYEYNLLDAVQCSQCKNYKNATAPPQPANGQRQSAPPAPQTWSCQNPGCGLVGNDMQKTKCGNCHTPRSTWANAPQPQASNSSPAQQSQPSSGDATSSWTVNVQFDIQMNNNGWVCPCSATNLLDTNICGGCSNYSPFAMILQYSWQQKQQQPHY